MGESHRTSALVAAGPLRFFSRTDLASMKRALAVLVATLLFGLAIGLLPLQQAAIIVIGCGAVVLVLARPNVGLWALAFAVPFASVRPVALGGFSVTASDLLVGVVALSWLLREAFVAKDKVRPGQLLLPSTLFLLVVVFAAIGARSLDATLKEVLRWAELVIVYFVSVNLLRTEAQRRWLLLAILLAASIEALIGCYQFLLGVGPPSFALGRFMRAYGTFSQPNPFAGYLGMVFPVAAAIAVGWLLTRLRPLPAETARATARSRRVVRHDLLVLAAWAAALLSLAGLAFSMSRGAWLGAAVAAVVMISVASRKGFVIVLCLIVVVALVLTLGAFNVLPESFTSRLTQMTEYFGVFDARQVQATSTNWAIVERMAHWQAAWDMFAANPVLGVGPGNYAVAYDSFALPGWNESLGHAHNIYIHMLAELGLIGGIAYLLLVCAWLWHAFRTFRARARSAVQSRLAKPSVASRVVALGLLGALVATCVHNGFDNLYVHDMNVQIGMILGLTTSIGLSGDA